MKPVGLEDYYQCRRCFGGARLDYASLTDFYLPLIGADAYATYLALDREDGQARSHNELLRVLDLTPGEFEKAIEALEAVGLVRTFVSHEGVDVFLYCLYAPLHANDFQKDIMLSGTLKGKIGEESFLRLAGRHEGEEAPKDLEEVSASFPDHFKATYDAKYYLGVSKTDKRVGKAVAQTGFDSASFLRYVEEIGLKKNALSPAELEDIGKIAALYSVSAKEMAKLVFDTLKANQPTGKKVDFPALSRLAAARMPFEYAKPEPAESSEVSGDSAMANLIRVMDATQPSRFLSYMQKRHRPAESDLKLIERLMLEIGLPAPCVNALVYYTLMSKDNALPSAYCEKIAASMVREGCRTARDAMDFLERGKRGRKKPAVKTPGPANVEPEPSEPKKDEDDGEDLDALLADLYKD